MKTIFSSLVNKLTGKKEPGRASRSPVAAPRATCPRSSDIQVLYQKDGWGLYTPTPVEIIQPNGNVEVFKSREAGGLTHIGCACYYPNWSISIVLWAEEEQQRFHCQECPAELSIETYNEFVQVFKLLNGF